MLNEPQYHLEGVIRTRDELEDFSGPLELILMLLSKNRIEIRDIRISELLEQYLDYLREMQEMDLEIASEFVQMASHLTYIKTKMLLTEDREPTELEELVSALEELRSREAMEALRQVIPELGEMSADGLRMYSRGPLPREERPYDYHHAPEDLIASLTAILLRGTAEREKEDYTALQRAVPRAIAYSVRDKSEELLTRLRGREYVPLSHIFGECKSKSEIVAAFLSVLELCFAGRICMEKDEGGCRISEVRCVNSEESE